MRHTRRLIEIMAQLRHPEQGCPWDLRQDFASLVPYTLEEAYEVADAVERRDFGDLRAELGDLLLQVAFHSRIAEESGLFDFEAVAAGICDKLIRRHPHVFDGRVFETDADRQRYWEESKIDEQAEKSGLAPDSALDGVASSLPALMQADKIQKKAARATFDWPDTQPVFAKVEEELMELRTAFEADDQAAIEDEVGDLLFAVVNLARHLEVDAETALRASNRKFADRFRYMERRLGSRSMAQCEPEMLDTLWGEAKRVLASRR
ncbi:MAG: nucleoside triphosphate pyrophosphohydrolase [Methylococcaceae bacterium]|nr:nucleoside triphosphate pyrophosphohydrolase [Methylococcaceae bacterium]